LIGDSGFAASDTSYIKVTDGRNKMLADLRVVNPDIIVTKNKYLLAAQIRVIFAGSIT
jgi:hypothetical protein